MVIPLKKITNTHEQNDRVGSKTFKTSKKGIQFIKEWEKKHGGTVAVPRYFYLRREVKLATGLYMYEEFPRSFYLKKAKPNRRRK